MTAPPDGRLSTILEEAQRCFGADARIVAVRKDKTVPEPAPKKLTMHEMSRFVDDRLVTGCRMDGGAYAGEANLTLFADDVAALKQIASALEVLAPHANAIRRLVAASKRGQ
jgi:hypothetical protein